MSDTFKPQIDNNVDEEEILISKSQLKREAEAVLSLAEKLVALPKSQLAKVPLSDVVRDGVDLARRLDNNNAKKRQMRYIAKQLSDDNLQAIDEAFEGFHQQSLRFRGKILEIEAWCSRLIDGDNNLLEQLITDNPLLERQHLRQLLRQISKDIKAGKSDASQKKLFRYLQENTG